MQDSFQVHEMTFDPSKEEAQQDSLNRVYQQGEVPMKSNNKMFLILSVLVLLGGTATGVGLSKLNAKEQSNAGESGVPLQQVATGAVREGDVFGSPEEKDFKDSAEGYLELGGLDGEGSHKLLREGGPSQNVYLTSSSTDLDKFDGMKVQVWGETFKGQKAGWLMDVGRVKVVEVNAQPPADAQRAGSATEGGNE
ncbi:hypothetical protein H3C66_02735 [Patescibacteria group bacterium]|nr:hypothetical protein [Patescibacteria group bacterium]